MLYYLFEYLDKLHFPGAGAFHYISFRAVMAALTSLLIVMFFGERLIRLLQRMQVGESIRDLGLDGQMEKKGTPTMGGLIILAGILIPTLLFAKLENTYVIVLVVSTIGLGLIGFLDDYIKVFRKNKEGLAGRFKIVGQVSVGIFVGLVLLLSDDVVVRDYLPGGTGFSDVKSLITTVPFFKENQLDYGEIFSFIPEGYGKYMYVLVVVFIVTAVSNGANITDGIDGLAAGTSAIIVATLAAFAYVSGNAIFADFLNIVFIPYSGEVVIFCLAFIGATIGFLWHNSYPAKVFMGDTGSLSIGGAIGVLALILRKELLIPVLCGIFLVENLSVLIQVYYFKYTRKKYGEGRRVFLMSPLHHHYQKKGMHESKIVTRFWIVGILLAILTLATLKLR